MENFTTKKSMSDEERLSLAAKLDRELDEFIDSLPKRRKEESVSFNRWEEEITNHPFFMKEAPEPGSELHPLYEGLQKLKYDPDENEPEELAIAYKDDGNFNFKHKKYRMAIISYTEGIKVKCGNIEIEANLYNNRSAAHYFLNNYRSSLIDAEWSLKLKPDYEKVLMRAAICCFKLEKYDKAVEYCDRILDKNKYEENALQLRKKSINEAKIKERNRRKREMAQKQSIMEETQIISEILKRGIKIEGEKDNLSLSKLEPQFPELFNSRVSINENGHLVWPVILFYPEYKVMDYIQHFNEHNTFMEQISHIFKNYPEWDKEKKYQSQNLNVYFENQKGQIIKIDVNKTLLEILKLDTYAVKDGTPRFIVLLAGSKAEKLFLKQS